MDMIGSNNVYEAERILDHKKIKGKRHFLIKWSGWDDTNNTWEPERNIIDKRLIEFYFKSLKEEKSTDSQKPSNKPTSKIKKEDVEPTTATAAAGKSTTNEGGDLMRSAKREAEGLRPIKSSQSTTVAGANTSSSEVSLSNSDLPSMRRRRRKLSDDMSTTTSTSAASSNKRRSTNTTPQATTMRTRSAQQQHEDGEKEKGTTASGRLRRSNRARNLTRTNLVDETTSSEDGEDDDDRDIDRSNIEDMNQIISEFAETDIDPYDAEDDEIRTSNNKRNLQSSTGRNKTTKKSNEDEIVKKPSVKTEKKDAYEFESEEEGETYEDEDDDDDNASATTASSSGSFFSTRTFLTSHSAAGTMSDDVVITDVTHGVVTVTIKECLSPDGFFKNRHL